MNVRFQVQDSLSASAQPDSQGNYLFWPGKPEFDQVNSLYYATFTLRMFEGFARHPIPWSFGTERLIINPHAGQGGNAFYSELDHQLGFNGFMDGDTVIQSAQSADVVSHETAHAVLMACAIYTMNHLVWVVRPFTKVLVIWLLCWWLCTTTPLSRNCWIGRAVICG